ncbi:MAG: VRR-NUC domain-containing protein [Pseudomonadales bacterium]|jgi:hypothetical protein|nr:VRR-NUC domain-containing protein [Pseudomonadales bacterium]
MPPPHDYYLGKLELLLDWVCRHHGALLDASARGFHASFLRLPRGARRLWVRLVLRRGPAFRVDGLDYEEVPDRDHALIALMLAGLVRVEPAPGPRSRLMTVPELGAWLRAAGCAPQRGAGRGALLEDAERLLAAQPARGESLPAVVVRQQDGTLDLFRLLFFANRRQDLTEFILEDVGVLRYVPVEATPGLPWTSAVEARHALAIHAAADALHDQDGASEADLRRLQTCLADPAPDGESEARRWRALARLGRRLAARGDREGELACLLAAAGPPARERAVRLLVASGRSDDAAALLAAMAAAPSDAGEARFACRFDLVSGRCRPERRRSARWAVDRVCLPGAMARGRVETTAAALYEQRGSQAFHLEGRTMGLLFMLGCWDIVFAPRPGAFVQPFQAGPLDLFSPDFAPARRAMLERRLDDIARDRFDLAAFLATWDRWVGTVNALLPWRCFTRAMVASIIGCIAPAQRRALCAHVAAHPLRARRGFPDLTVIGGAAGCVAFAEIKGPGDQLRPEQREWLDFLHGEGLRARVLEVRWT